ncbi:MAG: glutamate 5-kinase [Rhodospirillaceae bacterium]|nr:glutamate 5-kinase [Rhodospirillaceae bacterium]
MNPISKAKRIVIKIGSSLIIDQNNGRINNEWLSILSSEINNLIRGGKEIIIVSSGAIGLGKEYLNIKTKTLKLEESQAAAAAGQSMLIHAYNQKLEKYNIKIAQILLTLDDTEERRKYLNAKNTFDMLLKLNVIPIVNENDTIATSEIRFGDNDTLSARVAIMMSADCLILLSNVDGLYSDGPNFSKTPNLLKRVDEINPEIEKMAGDSSGYGKGGMVTKINAAKLATSSGCATIIAKGSLNKPIENIINNGKHTFFKPIGTPQSARKKWIASSLNPLGRLFIDNGAKNALNQNKSLLPAGVVRVSGKFSRGDLVLILDEKDNILARGLVAYSYEDAQLIIGHKSSEIEKVLGYRGRDELVHRDDLVTEIN